MIATAPRLNQLRRMHRRVYADCALYLASSVLFAPLWFPGIIVKIWELVERSLYNVRDGDSLSVQRLDEDYMLIFCLVNFILDTCRFWYFNVLGLGMREKGRAWRRLTWGEKAGFNLPLFSNMGCWRFGDEFGCWCVQGRVESCRWRDGIGRLRWSGSWLVLYRVEEFLRESRRGRRGRSSSSIFWCIDIFDRRGRFEL